MYTKIAAQITPILVGLVLSYLFWRDNVLLTILYLFAIIIVLRIRYYPGDFGALSVGFIVGLIVEIPGTTISGYQSFTNPDFFGIPMWLPLAWAYGLMAMKRIGMILVEYGAR